MGIRVRSGICQRCAACGKTYLKGGHSLDAGIIQGIAFPQGTQLCVGCAAEGVSEEPAPIREYYVPSGAEINALYPRSAEHWGERHRGRNE